MVQVNTCTTMYKCTHSPFYSHSVTTGVRNSSYLKKRAFLLFPFNIMAKCLCICMEMLCKRSAKTLQNCCVLLETGQAGCFWWLTNNRVTYQEIVDSQNWRRPDRSKWWAGLLPSCCRLCAADVWPHSFIMPLWKAGEACLQSLYNYQEWEKEKTHTSH